MAVNRRLFLPILLGVFLVTGAPSGAMAAPGWVTPMVPYPPAVRYTQERGIIKLKVTTDATGKVAKVVISVSAKQRDIPNLAEACKNWVLAKWSGPPNQVLQTQVQFVLR